MDWAGGAHKISPSEYFNICARKPIQTVHIKTPSADTPLLISQLRWVKNLSRTSSTDLQATKTSESSTNFLWNTSVLKKEPLES